MQSEGRGWVIAKRVIGIISIALFVLIMFQSCAVEMANTLLGDENDLSGGAGVLLALAMLTCGAIGIAARKSKGAGITAGAIYIFAALVGFVNLGIYADLPIWSFVALVFGVVFILGSQNKGATVNTVPYNQRVIQQHPQQPYIPMLQNKETPEARLCQLKEMSEQGLISATEYEEKRKKVLEEL